MVAAPGNNENVMIPEPPVVDAVILPVAVALHNAFVLTTLLHARTVGCVITTIVESVHPLTSVTVTVYVPANFPVYEPVVFTTAPGCKV